MEFSLEEKLLSAKSQTDLWSSNPELTLTIETYTLSYAANRVYLICTQVVLWQTWGPVNMNLRTNSRHE